MGIVLEKYQRMISKWAWHYSKLFRQDYKELEAQGYWIYCQCVKKHNPAKASFSTYLTNNLRGRIRDYARGWVKQIEEIEATDEINLDTFLAAPVQIDVNTFLEYAKEYLSDWGFLFISWLCDNAWMTNKRQVTIPIVCNIFEINRDEARQLFREVRLFWNDRGRAYFGAMV